MLNNKVLIGILFLCIGLPLSLRSMDKKKHNEVQANHSATDKATIEVIIKLLKQHNDAISSFGFPDRDSHAKYNNELPVLFNELKILYGQLSSEGKIKFSEDRQLFKSLKLTCFILSKGIIGIQLNPEYANRRTQTGFNNCAIQLDLQHTMMQWFASIINPKKRNELQPEIDKVNALIPQAKQNIPGFKVVAQTKATLKLIEQGFEKNASGLEHAKVMLEDPSDTNPPNLPFNPQKASLPVDIQRGLVLAGDNTQRVVNYFTANPQALLKQNEEGWTPFMQAAASRNIDLLSSLMQIIVKNHYPDSEKKYLEELRDRQLGELLEFACFFSPIESLKPLDPKKFFPHPLVKTGKYLPFICFSAMGSRTGSQERLKEAAKEGWSGFCGLGAYVFVKSLAVKAKTCPTIEVLDNGEEYNEFVKKRQNYQQSLKNHIDAALETNNHIDADAEPKGITIAPLRVLIHEYLLAELPHAKDSSICVIS